MKYLQVIRILKNNDYQVFGKNVHYYTNGKERCSAVYEVLLQIKVTVGFIEFLRCASVNEQYSAIDYFDINGFPKDLNYKYPCTVQSVITNLQYSVDQYLERVSLPKHIAINVNESIEIILPKLKKIEDKELFVELTYL